MRGLIFTVATAGLTIALPAAARGQQPSSKPSPNSVTVRGCVEGRVLTTTDDSSIGDGRHTFDLTSEKQMRALLKEHSGHIEEVTGVLKAGDGNGTVTVKEKNVGSKGRAYVGAGRTDPPSPSTTSEAVVRSSISVRSLTHIANDCSR
jgi:hypothetical protein